jgi:hypothetical protein
MLSAVFPLGLLLTRIPVFSLCQSIKHRGFPAAQCGKGRGPQRGSPAGVLVSAFPAPTLYSLRLRLNGRRSLQLV